MRSTTQLRHGRRHRVVAHQRHPLSYIESSHTTRHPLLQNRRHQVIATRNEPRPRAGGTESSCSRGNLRRNVDNPELLQLASANHDEVYRQRACTNGSRRPTPVPRRCRRLQQVRHLRHEVHRPSRRCHSSVGTPPSTRRLSSSVSALSQLSWHATFNTTTLVVRLGAVTAQLARHLRRDDSLSVSVRYCSSGNSTPCPSRASSMERSWHAPRRHVHRAPQLQPTHHLRRDAHRPS